MLWNRSSEKSWNYAYSCSWLGFLSFTERKRFYRDVSVYQQPVEDGGQFGINLDHRKLRTPLRKLFLVPNKRLAHAIAQEWGAQGQFVQPSLMHITALCNTVIDDPHKQSLEQVIDSLIPYLQSDTIWYTDVCMNIFNITSSLRILLVSGQLSQKIW